MKYVLEVCLITLAFFSAAVGQSATPPSIYTPTLRKGISVEMPVTKNAVKVPDADKEDALVVVVTRGGASYLITEPITPSALAKRIETDLRNSPDKKLYLKADAHAPYADVLAILDAARSAGVSAPILLTSQGSLKSEKPIMPEGLGVLLAPATSGEAPISVQLLNSESQARVDGKNVSWANLQDKLEQISQHSSEKSVELKAAHQRPFADVVRVVDACQKLGIQVILSSSRI
jgi:biopolymer transport protein ExbD